MQSAKCDIPILDHNEQNYPFSVKKTVTSTFQHPESVAQFNALGAYPSTTAAMLGECVPFLYGPTFLPSSDLQRKVSFGKGIAQDDHGDNGSI